MRAQVSANQNDLVVELVDRAYQAGVDDSLWPTFLERFADALPGENTALLVHRLGSTSNQAATHNHTDPYRLRSYNEYYSALNPWIDRGSADVADGNVRVGVSEMLCTPDVLLKTEFYNDWLRPQKLMHSIAALVLRSDRQIVPCSTLPPASAGSFSVSDIALYEARRQGPSSGGFDRAVAAATSIADPKLRLERLAGCETLLARAMPSFRCISIRGYTWSGPKFAASL